MFQEAALFRGLWGPGGRGVQYAVTVKRWGCMEARGSPGNGGALPTAAQQTGVLRSLGLQETVVSRRLLCSRRCCGALETACKRQRCAGSRTAPGTVASGRL